MYQLAFALSTNGSHGMSLSIQGPSLVSGKAHSLLAADGKTIAIYYRYAKEKRPVASDES